MAAVEKFSVWAARRNRHRAAMIGIRGRRVPCEFTRGETSGSGSHTHTHSGPKEPKHLFDIPVCQGVTRHLRRIHTKRDPLWSSSRSIYELRTIRVQLRVKIVNNRRQMARKGNCFLSLFLPFLFSNPRHLFVSSLSFSRANLFSSRDENRGECEEG